VELAVLRSLGSPAWRHQPVRVPAFPTVMCELLGIPLTDREWISVIVTDYGKDGESQRVTRELADYFAGLVAVARARARPQPVPS
jgi:hypothetical protein